MKARILTATVGGIRVAAPLPDGGVQHARIPDVHAQGSRARAIALVQHEIPRLAAVPGAVHAAFGVGAPGSAEGANVDDVGVGGMDGEAADMAGGAEADVAPRAPAIVRAIDAVA